MNIRELYHDLRYIVLFVSLFCMLNSFSQNIKCETTITNGMYMSESEGAIAKDNLSGCKFKIVTRPGEFEYYYIISYNGKIGTQGMSILRQYNESNREAKFYFTNGKSYTYTVRIADHTPADWKEFEGLADMYIVFFPVDKKSKFQSILEQMKLFNNVDISYITIGSYTLQFKSKGIKSSLYFSTLWKDMYNHGGWNFLTKSTESNSSSSTSGNFSSLLTSKNRSAIDLIRHPFGVLDGNLKNQSLASIVQTAKQRLKAEVSDMELDTFYSLNVYDFQGYDLNLYNKNITNASMYIYKNQKLRWDYSIHFKRNQYISKDVINYAKRIINEIKGTGFKLYPNSTSDKFPLMQLMSKGKLFVEVQVQDDPQSDVILVNIRVQPDGNDY